MVNQYELQELISSVQTHRINTLIELRRAERTFAEVTGPLSAEVSQTMTAAWSHYVNSNALLSELRSLTQNYPFSNHVIEEAKRRVYSDPESNNSWNFAWLVLMKIRVDNLLPHYASHQATQPSMWGPNTAPSAQAIEQLKQAFINEWTWALDQFLRHWERAPIR